MNEALCDFCRPIFEVYVDRAEHDLIRDWHGHHKRARDLRYCGETQCLLCAAIWSRTSREDKKMWLDMDTGASRSGAQISVRVRLVRDDEEEEVVHLAIDAICSASSLPFMTSLSLDILGAFSLSAGLEVCMLTCYFTRSWGWREPFPLSTAGPVRYDLI
jgi:hypothetical protein